MRVVAVGELASHIVFGVWVSLLCIWAMRIGLLPRFLAVWGIGAGLGGVLLPMGDALFLSWLGSAALLVLGLWPDGRPPAWAAGRGLLGRGGRRARAAVASARQPRGLSGRMGTTRPGARARVARGQRSARVRRPDGVASAICGSPRSRRA
jgi:hypothetical protein